MTILRTLFLLFIIQYSVFSNASLIIQGSSGFKAKVNTNLAEARRSSPHLSKLIQNIERSSSTITIKPVTNDKSTWHKSGKKSRSHTKAQDNLSRGAARNSATDSIIYINTNRITQTHKSYTSGTLIHELVHAHDLANGKYHGTYPVREKRAVFFQNIWRDSHSRALREDYHGRFETGEYRKARQSGNIDTFVYHFFEYNNTP